MTLFDASVHGLRARVREVRTDMAHWVGRASAEGDLRQHHSQLDRLHAYLGGTLNAAVLGKPVDPEVAAPFAGGVDDVPGYRRSVGTVHLLWEFFRDKLAQRDMDAVAAHLGVADDLAWACYQPFLAAATAAHPERFAAASVKEPPLVFYSTDRTPFAQARTKALHPAGLDAKDLEEFEVAVQRLPVPVIGLPWEVANRMPETALVGHEVGHVIAEDLGLAAEARQAVQALTLDGRSGPQRRRVWLAWCDEVFADLVGVLATGTAFVHSLTAEMAGNRNEIRQLGIDPIRPGRYPTPMLRVALCERFQAGSSVSATTGWSEAYGPGAGSSQDYLADVPAVAAALLERSWDAVGGSRLAEVLPWDRRREDDAHRVATKTLRREAVPVAFDVRLWVAAAGHAYRAEPDTYTELELDRALATHIVGQRSAGVRSSRSVRESLVVSGTRGPGDRTEQLRAADRQAGAELARHMNLT